MVLRAICKDADQIVTSPASPGSALFRDEREGRDGNVLHAPDAIVGCGTACAVFQPTAAMEERIGMSACAAKNGKRRDPVNAI